MRVVAHDGPQRRKLLAAASSAQHVVVNSMRRRSLPSNGIRVRADFTVNALAIETPHWQIYSPPRVPKLYSLAAATRTPAAGSMQCHTTVHALPEDLSSSTLARRSPRQQARCSPEQPFPPVRQPHASTSSSLGADSQRILYDTPGGTLTLRSPRRVTSTSRSDGSGHTHHVGPASAETPSRTSHGAETPRRDNLVEPEGEEADNTGFATRRPRHPRPANSSLSGSPFSRSSNFESWQ